MAAKLYDTRDQVRRLLGDKYQARVDEFRPYLEKEAEQHNGEILPAMIALIKRLHDNVQDLGIVPELLMATAVEMVEG